MENIKSIIESLLFISEEPLSIDRLHKVLETVERSQIRETLASLAQDYETRHSGFLLSEVAGGYQLRSCPANAEWIKRLIQPHPVRLSKASLETLAIVAYKQPVIRSDIEHIRGVDCGGVLRMLLERKLIRVLGRKEIPGRPLIYATTKFFLELFDLRDLKDLPTLKEIEALGETAPDENAGTALKDPVEPAQTHTQAAEQTPHADLNGLKAEDNPPPEP